MISPAGSSGAKERLDEDGKRPFVTAADATEGTTTGHESERLESAN